MLSDDNSSEEIKSIVVYDKETFNYTTPSDVVHDLSELSVDKLLLCPSLISLEIKTLDDDTFVSTEEVNSSIFPLTEFFDQNIKIANIDISTNTKDERTKEFFNIQLLEEEKQPIENDYSFTAYHFDDSENVWKENNNINRIAQFISDESIRNIDYDYAILTTKDDDLTMLVYRQE
jgi:hypothetical protein